MDNTGDVTVSFVGPGVMAEAMIQGLITRARVPSSRILVSGPRSTRLVELAERYGVATTDSNHEAAGASSVVVIAVKPQTVAKALADMHGGIRHDAVLLSIVAGATMRDLAGRSGHAAVVRAMPNTPGQIGEGVSVWTATPQADTPMRERARLILSALGQEIYVDDEDYLDMATALSGTGPSYVFLFMEAMVDAGVHLGFPRRIAEQLVVQTVRGSVAYYEHSPSHLARLRNQVTSPGGTSAAALYYLEKAGFRTAISRAIWAAYERSVQLGKGKKTGEVSDA
jgi:pyrroline-5-carboxylate reductase